ncbi:hypothetical protein HK097_010280 [Rhizophlyctis rosea]|uniref:BHLH domain-containing protein n=1 Tax=Rhizophlyctis rosea TaxID=64517 RepID=A0AAD5SI73_9FUNG|nr:hypothetical protein HK097_010280 [Rhizophlyctis rosea]
MEDANMSIYAGSTDAMDAYLQNAFGTPDPSLLAPMQLGSLPQMNDLQLQQYLSQTQPSTAPLPLPLHPSQLLLQQHLQNQQAQSMLHNQLLHSTLPAPLPSQLPMNFDNAQQQQHILNHLNMQQNMFSGEAFSQPHASTDFSDLMSPFLIGGANMAVNDDMQEDEDLLLTPLISPAMTPSIDFTKMNLAQNEVFSPLTSPALHPRHTLEQLQHLPPTSLPPTIRRRDTASSSALGSERSKKTPLSSPYIIPRKSLSVTTAALSPHIRPLRSAGLRTSKSPEAQLPPAAQPIPSTPTIPEPLASSSTTNPSSSTNTGTPPPVPGAPPAPDSAVFKVPLPKQPNQPTAPFAPVPAQAGLPSQPSLQAQQAAAAAMYISPELTPQLNPVASPKAIAPVTPAQLMKMDQRPKEVAIAPATPSLISPSLKPLLPQGSAGQSFDAAIRLAQKSNYQNILEGDTEMLGLQYSSDISTGVEIRRTSHKQAEQRRRDSLKQCFEELKLLLPPVEEKNPSKVIILKKAYEYIEMMQKKERETQALIAKLEAEIRGSKEGKKVDGEGVDGSGTGGGGGVTT